MSGFKPDAYATSATRAKSIESKSQTVDIRFQSFNFMHIVNIIVLLKSLSCLL